MCNGNNGGPHVWSETTETDENGHVKKVVKTCSLCPAIETQTF